MNRENSTTRTTVFICKATPGDDDFVLWLAPRLEAAGYKVFADILTLEPGDRWRKVVTDTLQNEAVKMLLCCRNSTLARNGVQEEIAIAEDLSRDLSDPRFIVPLRLEPYKKLFGIGGLQYIDFAGSWAQGLRELLDTLERRQIPRDCSNIRINPNWENYRKRLAISIESTPETLTSNWLRVSALPSRISYFEPTGAVNHAAMEAACKQFEFPAAPKLRGFFSFAAKDEIEEKFAEAGKFEATASFPLSELMETGCDRPKVSSRDARNMVSSMFRQAWESYCRELGLHEYAFSGQLAFYVGEELLAIGKKVPWGNQDRRRSSMLRNIARGTVWQYGVSATPMFWPFPHFRLKARVVFADIGSGKAVAVIEDTKKQHRLRRSVCKGWRNKQWRGRLMAFVSILGEGAPKIELRLSSTVTIGIDASPLELESPVSTQAPDEMPDDSEEHDISTLGNVIPEQDD